MKILHVGNYPQGGTRLLAGILGRGVPLVIVTRGIILFLKIIHPL